MAYGKGITPACAGKTHLLNPQKTTDKDHPRVCGENDDYEELKAEYGGSPPRVRGKLNA